MSIGTEQVTTHFPPEQCGRNWQRKAAGRPLERFSFRLRSVCQCRGSLSVSARRLFWATGPWTHSNASKHAFCTNVINLWISVSVLLSVHPISLETNRVWPVLAWKSNRWREITIVVLVTAEQRVPSHPGTRVINENVRKDMSNLRGFVSIFMY